MAVPKTAQAPNGFVFKKPTGRPFRVVSIETEVDGDGDFLSDTLYRKGFVATPRVERYGFTPAPNYQQLGFIKYDGSVTGGEVVFERMDLTNPVHGAVIAAAYDSMYTMERNKNIQTNPNCGGHITIDAAGYGHFDLLRLLITFGHLEEPIFRLAGAGKKYGHRSLFPGHDRAAGGGGYANPVVKGPFKPDTNWYTKVFGMQRMSAINVTKAQARSCRCGGTTPLRDGQPRKDPKGCTCPTMNRCFEWRIWNSMTNPRILYAWIGLMQALHAYCWRPAGPEYIKYDDMDILPWKIKPFNKIMPEDKAKAQERVEWMFNELPLTDHEKEALSYAYMRTPYKVWGRRWFDKLADSKYKKPPFPNGYTTGINRTISKLKADEAPFEEAPDEPTPVDQHAFTDMVEDVREQDINPDGMPEQQLNRYWEQLTRYWGEPHNQATNTVVTGGPMWRVLPTNPPPVVEYHNIAPEERR